MKNFKVKFERSNGTIGNDTFTDNTRQEAISSFHACYRHDTYKILSVIEIETESKTKKLVTITKKEWNKIPKDYKIESAGQPKKVFLGCIQKDGGTVLVTEGLHFKII